jgi:P-type conjugative transfer protein TrbG
VTDAPSPPNDSTPRPVQRRDEPEAPVTPQFSAALLVTPDDAPEAASPPANKRGMPTPPSRRRGALTAFAAGAVAPLGPTATRTPLITRPKPVQPAIEIPAAVLIAPDLGATLPPRAERGPAAAAGPEETACDYSSIARSRPSFIALGAGLGCILAYAIWATVLHPAVADAAPERGLPRFLLEPAATGSVPVSAEAAPPPPSKNTLPPALAATLAQSVPTQASEHTPVPPDAGAPAAPPELLEDGAPPIPEDVSAETQHRADTLRAALEAHRVEPRPVPPTPPATRAPPASPSSEREPALVTRWPADETPTARTRSRPRSIAHAEPSLAGLPDNATIRPLTQYTYADQALFAVAAAPMRVTDLVLERGEKLVSQPTAGDAARWVISVVQTDAQSHVFVKPLRPGLRTNLTLTTNRRSYFLELSCRDDGSYMAGVEWRYPTDDAARRREALAQADRERQSTTAVSDLQALRFDYRIDVAAGTPSWKPATVFDDGQKTFIRFPRPVTEARAPLLLILRSGGAKDATYVNYRIKGDLYVLDRLIDAAELRLSSDDPKVQDVVRITRKH